MNNFIVFIRDLSESLQINLKHIVEDYEKDQSVKPTQGEMDMLIALNNYFNNLLIINYLIKFHQIE